MSNDFRVKTIFQESDKKWYLDIIPPVYMVGATVVQEGTLYFKKGFNSKEEAHDMARNYLAYLGIQKNIIEKINYE
jgi:hypothetical protein